MPKHKGKKRKVAGWSGVDNGKVRIAREEGQRSIKVAIAEFEQVDTNVYSSQARQLAQKWAKDSGHEVHRCACKDTGHKCGPNSNCMNRLLEVECDDECPVGSACMNRRFQKKQWKQVKVDVASHPDMGLGLYAQENIRKGDFIYEYIGEVITQDESADRLENEYREEKHKYILTVGSGLMIDSTRMGQLARFVNHSCEPNSEAILWASADKPVIGYFAKRNIAKGEEISINYKFQRYGGDQLVCNCGAQNCNKRLDKSQGNRERCVIGVDPVLSKRLGVAPSNSALEKMCHRIRSMVPNIDFDPEEKMEQSSSPKSATPMTQIPPSDEKRLSEGRLALVSNIEKSLMFYAKMMKKELDEA
mmetsp:Transcript_7422/g.11929  ORF Transcript_7422/g.11929 Transcript_7422/m.11929 type:complete len:361 (-) Transcript_7422:1699-2781(-)